MHIVEATLYFIVLEFITIFSWFTVVINIKNAINEMVTAAASIAPESVQVGQNVVTGLNVVFLMLVICWICWYVYMAHSSVNETTYQNIPTTGYRRW
jgi:hypothetical protein